MKRKLLFKVLNLLLYFALSLGLAGCIFVEEQAAQAPVSILSVAKTSSEGLVDTYTIYYSDGTTSTFEITNGENGKDGKDGENANGDPVSIIAIRKTAVKGLVDTYTIYYTDGTESTFEITNGANGEDGKDVTALELYEAYKAIYGDDLEYAEFLALYTSADTDSSAIINACLQSVGKVYCPFTEPDESTTEDTEATKPALYTGACVIYRMDGEYTYFLTNYHVVYDKDAVGNKISDTVYCYLYGSEGAPAKKTDTEGNTYIDYGDYAIECQYIGGAVQYDLAIIRAKTADVLGINENVKAVTFAEDYHVGQTAIAIGNPNGDGISVTEGIISVDNDMISLSIDGTSRSYRSIRIDTALYHGNSGGGLFNGHGELIGIANAGNVTDQNINYAVPIQIIKGVTDNIMIHYSDGDDSTNGVYKITVGVTVTSRNSKYTYDTEKGYGEITEEIVVSGITDDGIAQMLGLKAGDVIKAIVIDGVEHKLNRYFDIGDHILYLTKDVAFSFIYERNGAESVTAAYTVKASDLTAVA